MISKENRIDIQAGNSCSGYSIAYILRHYDILSDGDEIYKKLPNKMDNGLAAVSIGVKPLKMQFFARSLKKRVCIMRLPLVE